MLTPSTLADLATLIVDCGADARASGPDGRHCTASTASACDHRSTSWSRGRNVQRARHRIHTTSDLPLIDRATVEGIPALGDTDLIDLARFVDERKLTAALDPRQGRLDGRARARSPDRRVALERSAGIPKLLAVIEGAECHAGRPQLARATVPRFSVRRPVCRAADARCSRGPRIVSFGSIAGSRARPSSSNCSAIGGTARTDQLARDAERPNGLVLDGLVPPQFTYEQVTADPDWVLSQAGRALDQAA